MILVSRFFHIFPRRAFGITNDIAAFVFSVFIPFKIRLHENRHKRAVREYGIFQRNVCRESSVRRGVARHRDKQRVRRRVSENAAFDIDVRACDFHDGFCVLENAVLERDVVYRFVIFRFVVVILDFVQNPHASSGFFPLLKPVLCIGIVVSHTQNRVFDVNVACLDFQQFIEIIVFAVNHILFVVAYDKAVAVHARAFLHGDSGRVRIVVRTNFKFAAGSRILDVNRNAFFFLVQRLFQLRFVADGIAVDDVQHVRCDDGHVVVHRIFCLYGNYYLVFKPFLFVGHFIIQDKFVVTAFFVREFGNAFVGSRKLKVFKVNVLRIVEVHIERIRGSFGAIGVENLVAEHRFCGDTSFCVGGVQSKVDCKDRRNDFEFDRAASFICRSVFRQNFDVAFLIRLNHSDIADIAFFAQLVKLFNIDDGRTGGDIV